MKKAILSVLLSFLISLPVFPMDILKQSTATEEVVEFVLASDGITAASGLTVTNFDCFIIKHADANRTATTLTTTASGGDNDSSHLDGGAYRYEFSASNTDTLGRMFFKCECATAAPFSKWYTVVPAGTWNGLVANGLGTTVSFWDTLLSSITDANGIGFLLKTMLDQKVSEGGGQLEIGTAQAGGANTITLDSTASATNDIYKFGVISLISGTGTGQWAVISAYDGTTKVATVIVQNTSNGNWHTNPSSDTGYAIRGERR